MGAEFPTWQIIKMLLVDYKCFFFLNIAIKDQSFEQRLMIYASFRVFIVSEDDQTKGYFCIFYAAAHKASCKSWLYDGELGIRA